MLSVIKSTLKNAFISKISPMLTDWGLPDILLLIPKDLSLKKVNSIITTIREGHNGK